MFKNDFGRENLLINKTDFKKYMLKRSVLKINRSCGQKSKNMMEYSD